MGICQCDELKGPNTRYLKRKTDIDAYVDMVDCLVEAW